MSPPSASPDARELFHFCARCGSPRNPGSQLNPFQCGRCGFTYYFNVSSAVAVFIEDDAGRVLFIRRGREPSRGKLALAGGFTDPGETGEEATRREIHEELGAALTDLRYLGTWPNRYLANGFFVNVLDIFYCARLVSPTLILDAHEVSGAEWLIPQHVDPAEVAFPSMRLALAAYLEQASRPGPPPALKTP